jgi:Transposase Tn5 dimerisation domain/Transposase DNA-binding
MNLSERQACREWAYNTFGDVRTGNDLRTTRLVSMAAAVVSRPAGRVSEVFTDSADREGAYRLLSNAAVSTTEVTRGVCNSTTDRCVGQGSVYVAVDGSSLSLPDADGARGLGGVGAWKDHGTGLQVITALAMDTDGVPIGVCAQTWWARTSRSPKRRCSRRKLEDKETRFMQQTWLDAQACLKERCPDTRIVGVMDRGFDCWPILRTASTDDAAFIVRAQYSRRLLDSRTGTRRYLFPTLAAQPVIGRYDVEVPARDGHPTRTARMHVRAMRVTIELRVTNKRREYVELNAVHAYEVRGPKERSLSWFLLTTEPIDTFDECVDIVRAYAMRWRIEELHRAWKSGVCNVEDTQLRSRDAIIKWATIHCAVAARAVRLARLARTNSDAPASEEFSQLEIDAAIVLRKKRTKLQRGDTPSLGEMVRLVADIGGYVGKSSGGPPGPIVIARGLADIAVATRVLENMRKT